jgi:hypothetical protein
MKTETHFSDEILAAVGKAMVIGLRVGDGTHRIIGIWAVVVEKRVFVRSWSLKPQGWYSASLKEPSGLMQIAGQELAIRIVHTRSERLKDAVNQAYRAKYKTPGSLQYVKDLCEPKSRATTTELVPI